MPSTLLMLLGLRASRISGGAVSAGASLAGLGFSGGAMKRFGRTANTFGDFRSFFNSGFASGCQTNCRELGVFAEATISCAAIFTSARGGFRGIRLRVGGGDTSGSFSRKLYHTSLLACGAIVCA